MVAGIQTILINRGGCGGVEDIILKKLILKSVDKEVDVKEI